MLSRIADSLFWITRYLERAEDTARILDVNYYMMLEGAQRADRLRWAPLVSIAGAHDEFFARYPEADPRSVLEFLGFSAEHPDSIMECVGKARENARTIRDRISREMWEDINGLYLEVGRFTVDDLLAAGPHRFCELVKSGSHRFMGVSRATFPRDEGWHFLNAGQALERAEMTARIVDVQYHTLVAGPATTVGDPDTHQWMAVLKSVAAYEFYRRTYNTRIEPTRVAELLLLHPQHPRSLRFSVGILQSALRAISQSGVDTYANEAERLTGRLYDSLKYDRIEEILGRGLHPFLTDVQRTCRTIGEELARTYFYYEVGA
jgi:uncharacterized alpha-E superfamily protein